MQQTISESTFSSITGLEQTELDEFKESPTTEKDWRGKESIKNRRELAIGSLPTGSRLAGQFRVQNSSSDSLHIVPVLATSFRDPSCLPMALPEDFEGNSEDDDSADEAIIRKSSSKGRVGGSGRLNNLDNEEEEDDEEEELNIRSVPNKSRNNEHEGVFGDGLED